ncbi:MAG: hypothetical protein JW809_19820 [Pirellulales bacterium]|nr:hypothetical protein [Pirellulales bacterium]
MKVKMKFDKQAIVGFLARNGEKILFGAVVLCFLGFVYAGVGRDRFDKTPDDLRAAAEKIQQGIENSDGPEVPKTKEFTDEIAKIVNPVAVKPYQLEQAWNPPVPDPLNPRGEPALFTVEDLRASAGVGRFTLVGGAGGGMMGGAVGAGGNVSQAPQGRRWVLLTGLVSAEKLFRSYQDCFRDAAKRFPNDLLPTVTYYQVERAEVESEDDDVENLKWAIPYGRLNQYIEKQRMTLGAGTEVVPTQFTDLWLTSFLPQRADRNWGDEVAHPPEIPLMAMTPEGMPGMPGHDPTKPAGAPGDEPGSDDPDVPGTDEPGARGPGAPGMGMGMGGPGMGMGGPGMGMGGPGMGMPGMGMGGPGMGMGGPGMGMGPGAGMPGGGMAGQTYSPYRLFRFFDFTAQPGKRYRYRVRIYFANPNYNVPPQYLARQLRERGDDKKAHIVSPWSDPSDVVFVPRDDRLLAVSVSSPSQVDVEPSATILAIHWDEQTGAEVSSEFPVKLGMVVDFPDQDPPQPTAAQGGMAPGPFGPALPEGGDAAPDRGGRRRTPRAARGTGAGAPPIPGFPMPPVPEKIDYMTKMLVLDMQGGQRLPGKNRDLTYPGEILLMDPDGVLQVRSDVDDQPEVEKQKSTATGALGAPGMGMPGMGMPGMGMPGMGMPGMGMGMPGAGGGAVMPPRMGE